MTKAQDQALEDLYNQQKEAGAREKRELSKPSDQDGGFHIVFPLMVRAEEELDRHFCMRNVLQSAFGSDTKKGDDKFLMRFVIVHSTTPGRLEGKVINPNRETSMLLTWRTKAALFNILTHPMASKKGYLSYVDEDGNFTPGTPIMIKTEVGSNGVPTYTWECVTDEDVVGVGAVVPETVEIYDIPIEEQAGKLSFYNSKKLDPQLSTEDLAAYGVEPEAAPDTAF